MFLLRRLGGRKVNNLVIRLKRKGCLNYPVYEIVLSKEQAKISGPILLKLGFYNPNLTEKQLFLDSSRLAICVAKGAFVNTTVKKLLSKFVPSYLSFYDRSNLKLDGDLDFINNLLIKSNF